MIQKKEDSIKKIKININVLLSIVIIIATFSIGILFIYMPFSNKNRTLRLDILQERERNVLLGKIRALNKHVDFYDKRLLNTKDISWLLKEVSNIARSEGLPVSFINPGAPEDRGLYIRVYVTVEAVSDYHKLGKFLSLIESSEKFLRVETIKMRRYDSDSREDKNPTGSKSFDVKAEIIISTVVLKSELN